MLQFDAMSETQEIKIYLWFNVQLNRKNGRNRYNWQGYIDGMFAAKQAAFVRRV